MQCDKVWLVNIGEPLPKGKNKPHRMCAWKDRLEGVGKEVTFFTTDFEHQHKTWIKPEEVPPHFVLLSSFVPYKTNVSVWRLLNHLLIGLSFGFQALKRKKPDVIVVSYPTVVLAFVAVLYSRIRGVRVIVDVRDLWPDIFIKSALLKFLLLPQILMKAFIMKRANEVIGVSPGYVKWGTGNSTVNPNNVLPLSHYSIDAAALSAGVLTGTIQFVFVGSLGSTYDLDLIVDISKLFKASNLDYKIVVCGDGPLRESFCKNIEGDTNIQFRGWLNKEEMKEALNEAHFGLMLYKADSPQGWPNKLFEYMSSGLPIINSLNGESWNLIEDKKLGINITRHDLNLLADWIITLKENSELNQALFERNIHTFQSNFDERQIFKSLVRLIEDSRE